MAVRPGAAILGASRAIPGEDVAGTRLTNLRLSELMVGLHRTAGGKEPSTPTFPEERIGVKTRSILDAGLTSRDLGIAAGEKLLRQLAVDRSKVRVILVATVTPDKAAPALATSVQSALALPEETIAFDINLGCNGFLAALQTGSGLLGAFPVGSYALVIGTEAMSRVLDATDRQTCCIFGDGAGAVLLESGSGPGLEEMECYTRGEKGPLIEIAPAPEPVWRFVARDGCVQVELDPACRLRVAMDGRRVYRDMVAEIPRKLLDFAERRGVALKDIDFFLFHQANLRMIEAIAQSRSLQIGPERLLSNIERYGNTTSATIPLLLSDFADRGVIKSGQRLMLVGFGAGYSLGLATLTWR